MIDHREAHNMSEESALGYISIKDFAYETSNPLHYGYFEEFSDDEGSVNNEGHEEKEEHNKRQSIILPSEYIVNHKAVAIYDFVPENDNELELKEGDVVYISYRHGQGWLVAENQERTRTGLIPEEYVSFLEEDEDAEEDDKARPFYLTQIITQSMQKPVDAISKSDEEWEDIDDVESDFASNLKIANSDVE
ncbi:LAFE_0H07580g1_1 [Lachancea fermentati]|uniref:LAFE_0H07580g1_1 n=1 Tax=Lachancea fermentati TaxID=4955 RepID=A0A1G4MJW6_LACFM|nr:LAFE_0H07580g1_1 [Lachancea fermentati]